MSKNHATDNIYNILNTLKSLEPTPEQTVKAEAKRIYESVEAQGSIIAGVAGVEARLRQQFAESDFSDTSKAIQKSGKSKASADAITASIGRKKLGQAEMTRRSVAGKKHAHEGVAEGNHEGMYSPEAIKMGNHFIKEFNLTDDIDQQLAIEIVDNCLEGGLTDPMQIKKQVIKYLRQSGTNIQSRKQGMAEGTEPEDLGTVAEINRLIAKGMHETDAIHAVAKKYGDNPSELASFYYQHNMHEGTVHKGTYGTEYDPSDEEKRDKPKREIKHGQKGRPRAEKPMDSKSAPKGDIFGRTTGEVPKGKRGTKIKGHGNIDESTSYQKQNFMFESFNFANMMKETDQTVQEMLTELQGDIATFKMTGECSPKLDAFLRVHGQAKSNWPMKPK